MKHARQAIAVLVLALAPACGGETTAPPDLGPSTFKVTVTAVNGNTTLPTRASPLPANHGDVDDMWDFTVEARKSTGEPVAFEGYVRMSVSTGTVKLVTGEGASGHNILLKGGKAAGQATVTAMFGPTKLTAEDLGYIPAPPGRKPACSDGVDNDKDGLIDYPADPGCHYADDDNEEGGTFAEGASAAVEYALPKISDIRGKGAGTPYAYDAVEVNTSLPQTVIVTRVASDGFYVTDIDPAEMAGGYNSLFAFNFSTPGNLRVCDRITYLAGTANDFFGFTELNFPSYQPSYFLEGQGTCQVPEPAVILTDKPATCQVDADCANNLCKAGVCAINIIQDAVRMQRLQSSLVRLENVTVAKHFGPGLAKNNVFGDDASSCDFNGDGQVDFMAEDEGSCSEVCDADPDCSEWTAYSARGDVKVSRGAQSSIIKINVSTVSGFDPVAARGQPLTAVTGTMRKFSGGTLNWTVETRCADDLVCDLPGCGAKQVISSQTACVQLRTIDDNDEGTN
jgi:hypothetical protein